MPESRSERKGARRSSPIVVRDTLGREHRFDAPPHRIVSLVPSLTEALFWFGVGERVVGVTEYCVHPAEGVASLPRVGGTKNPALERVRALSPDLVIANREENRERDVRTLEADGIPVFVSYARSVTEARDELLAIGDLCGVAERARELAAEIESARAAVGAAVRVDGQRARPSASVRVLALIWRDPFMAVGPDTFAADLLRTSGGNVVAPDAERRYPRLSQADISTLDPEVVLLPTEPYAFSEDDRAELLAELDCAAARDGRIHVVEGELLSWYGPRIPRAIRELRQLLVG